MSVTTANSPIIGNVSQTIIDNRPKIPTSIAVTTDHITGIIFLKERNLVV